LIGGGIDGAWLRRVKDSSMRPASWYQMANIHLVLKWILI
jgi:hypothetical protein